MTTAQYLVVVIAALALMAAASALYVALDARSKAIAAESRMGRHQHEHRVGIEDEGLRRHRAGHPPLTGQIPAQTAEPGPVDPVTGEQPRADLPPLPPPGQIGRPS